MKRRTALALAGGLTLLDQLSKQALKDAQGPLIPGLLRLSGTRNAGAAFGLLRGLPWLPALIGGLACALVARHLWRAQPGGLFGLGLTLVLAGALGNLIDRLLLGHVIDFLELSFTRFAIFNLADVYVTLGCGLAALGVLTHREARDA